MLVFKVQGASASASSTRAHLFWPLITPIRVVLDCFAYNALLEFATLGVGLIQKVIRKSMFEGMKATVPRGGSPLKKQCARLILCLLFGFSLVLPFADPASEAASPITPSGLNTQVTLSAAPLAGKPQYDITGGTRPGGGVNLFHSFGDFNVPNNNIANFLNETTLPTSNILGRVTGGNISSIFGTIQTTGFGGANLFLMNPTGFLFGPNATVNVGGMVSFTTADYLRLADGVRFTAIPNVTADALLSIAPVAAFGFLGSNPGAITVQGSHLIVAEGSGISLVGGNITVENGAKLSAPGGQITLAALAGTGEVSTVGEPAGLSAANGAGQGTIQLTSGAVLQTSSNTGNAGPISIKAGQFVMDQATIEANSGFTRRPLHFHPAQRAMSWSKQTPRR